MKYKVYNVIIRARKNLTVFKFIYLTHFCACVNLPLPRTNHYKSPMVYVRFFINWIKSLKFWSLFTPKEIISGGCRNWWTYELSGFRFGWSCLKPKSWLIRLIIDGLISLLKVIKGFFFIFLYEHVFWETQDGVWRKKKTAFYMHHYIGENPKSTKIYLN